MYSKSRNYPKHAIPSTEQFNCSVESSPLRETKRLQLGAYRLVVWALMLGAVWYLAGCAMRMSAQELDFSSCILAVDEGRFQSVADCLQSKPKAEAEPTP